MQSSGESPSPSSQRRQQQPRINSLYRTDYAQWDRSSVCHFNPTRIHRDNPSFAPHPKAADDPDHFVSLKQKDFVRHPIPPPPAARGYLVPSVTPMMGETSTYRAEFVRRPLSGRPTRMQPPPPKRTPFEATTTSRADFVNYHPPRPVLVHPVEKLRFSQVTELDSTYRQSYNEKNANGREGYSSPRRGQRFRRDPGWVNGMNRADGDTFVSLNRHDFVEPGEDILPLLRTAAVEIDRSVVRRNKAFQNLGESED